MKKAINIVWDNGEEGNYGYAELPGTVVIPDEVAEDEVADYLSDMYEWCVCSYSLEKDETEDKKGEEIPLKWYWSLLNIDGTVVEEGSDYESREAAEAAAMEYIKGKGITDFEHYVLDVYHPTAKGKLFSASVCCPKCGKRMFIRVSDNSEYGYQCLYCDEDFYSFECPKTTSSYQNEKGEIAPLYEITLHGQSADWFRDHESALKGLCAKYNVAFLGCDSKDAKNADGEVLIDFGWEAKYPAEAPDAMTVQLFTDEVLELVKGQKTSRTGEELSDANIISVKAVVDTLRAIKYGYNGYSVKDDRLEGAYIFASELTGLSIDALGSYVNEST